MLLLPFVGFLADVEELRCDDMPTLGAPAIAEVAIEELGFGSQMVLRQCFGIGLEFVGWNCLARSPNRTQATIGGTSATPNTNANIIMALPHVSINPMAAQGAPG